MKKRSQTISYAFVAAALALATLACTQVPPQCKICGLEPGVGYHISGQNIDITRIADSNGCIVIPCGSGTLEVFPINAPKAA